MNYESHKINGKCKICKEPIVLGDNTRWKNTDYYFCYACTIRLHRQMELKEVLIQRKYELFEQLGELENQLHNLEKEEPKFLKEL